MRAVHYFSGLTAFGGDLIQRVSQPFHPDFDERGVVVEDADLVDLRGTVADFGLGFGDIFAILAAAGV